MQAPEIPPNEKQRIAALRSTNLLYSPAENRFDRITRLAAQVLDTPIAMASLVAEECQWFKSSVGTDVKETSREISFCGHAILGEETFVIEDATQDPRFADNPLVTGGMDQRFYAGHPLHTLEGLRIGTLCVIDHQPRSLSSKQLADLRDLAAIAETELQREQLNDTQRNLVAERDDLRRKASIDGLTRLWNRAAVMELLGAELARAKRGVPMCVAMVDADHFKKVNDEHGHQAGDAVLVEIAARIRRAIREFDTAGRYGGEEFIAVLSNCDMNVARIVCERIRSFVASEPFETPAGSINVSVSIGLAPFDPAHDDLESLIGAADVALYRAKDKGRNRVEFDNANDSQ